MTLVKAGRVQIIEVKNKEGATVAVPLRLQLPQGDGKSKAKYDLASLVSKEDSHATATVKLDDRWFACDDTEIRRVDDTINDDEHINAPAVLLVYVREGSSPAELTKIAAPQTEPAELRHLRSRLAKAKTPTRQGPVRLPGLEKEVSGLKRQLAENTGGCRT